MKRWPLLLMALAAPAPAEPGAVEQPGTAAAPDVRALRIDRQDDYWRRSGFVEMVPPVRLPTSHDATDLIESWLRLPDAEEARVSTRWLPVQQRHSLVFPAGTRSDRVESLVLPDVAEPRLKTVMDVRGTELGPQGRQRFHVFRPVDGSRHAPLRGWSWPRDDQRAQQEATGRLLAHAAQAGRPLNRPPLDAEGQQALRELNDCAACHQPDQPQDDEVTDAGNPRATDAAGFYVPLGVLQDEVALAATRPRDRNAADPYVTVRCGREIVSPTKTGNGGLRYRCADGSVPIGSRDIRRGLADGDAYTRQVCAARRYLYDHMDDAAREAFSAAFARCGIADGRGGPE